MRVECFPLTHKHFELTSKIEAVFSPDIYKRIVGVTLRYKCMLAVMFINWKGYCHIGLSSLKQLERTYVVFLAIVRQGEINKHS